MLHGDERSEVVLETSEVVVHASGLVHVREFQHDGSEFVIVGIDRGFLGKALEVIVRADAGVDWHKLLPEGHEETILIWGCVLPVNGLVIGSPPEGRLVFEKSSCELDSVSFGYGSEDAKLLHLEDPVMVLQTAPHM